MAQLKLLKAYDEIDTIRTFVFESDGVAWQPGQFRVYTLSEVAGDDAAKERVFTIASAPSENTVHISTRLSDSAFKQALNALEPGDTIEASDPEGDFIWDESDDTPVVMVAAGIGVTPYRAMFLERAAQDKKLPVHFVYFGRDDNFAFKTEFDQLAASHPEFTIDYVVGEPVSAETILAHAPEATDRTTFLSGPEPMVDEVGKQLHQRDIAIKQDWLPGYDKDNY